MRRDNFKNEELVKPIPEPKTTKRASIILFTALAIIAIGIITMLNWSLQNENILEIKNAPVPIRTIREHPQAGGVVILNVDYCKNYDIEGDLRVSFVSPSREIFLPLGKEQVAKGCQKAEFPVLIPRDLPPDTYEVKFRAVYDLNPLKQRIPIEFKSRSVQIDGSLIPTN